MLSSNDLDQYAMRSLTIFALSPLLSSPKLPSDPWRGLNSTGLTTLTTSAQGRHSGLGKREGGPSGLLPKKILQL